MLDRADGGQALFRHFGGRFQRWFLARGPECRYHDFHHAFVFMTFEFLEGDRGAVGMASALEVGRFLGFLGRACRRGE